MTAVLITFPLSTWKLTALFISALIVTKSKTKYLLAHTHLCRYSIPVCFIPSQTELSPSYLSTSINDFISTSTADRIYLVLDQVENHSTLNWTDKVILAQESDQQEGLKMHGFAFPQLTKELIASSAVIYYGPHAKVATDLGSLFYLQPSLLLDSTSATAFTINISRDLAKRTAAVNSIRGFDQIGILVENPNIQLHIQLAQMLQDLCFANNFFANILYVGRVNEMKIGNFPDLECFVHISCPGKSLFSFAKPVVSPFEFICAKFDVNFWEHQELRDLDALLDFCQVHQHEWIPEEARAANGQVVLRDLQQMTMTLSSIRQKYSYHGLQIDHANRDMTLHEGSTGTAAGYDYELDQE